MRKLIVLFVVLITLKIAEWWEAIPELKNDTIRVYIDDKKFKFISPEMEMELEN